MYVATSVYCVYSAKTVFTTPVMYMIVSTHIDKNYGLLMLVIHVHTRTHILVKTCKLESLCCVCIYVCVCVYIHTFGHVCTHICELEP
jgi:hypothetical protein